MPSQPPESRNQIPWNCQVLSGCRLQSETQVMVNTVCQLDWAAGCPHSWLNLISGNVSKSVYALELVSWVKQAGVPTEAQRESVGGGLNYLFLPGGRAENSGLMLPLGWACNTGSWLFRWVLGPLFSDWKLGAPADRQQMVGLLSPHGLWAKSL